MQGQKQENQTFDYWCHFCQISFNSELRAGKDIILCSKCNNDFCEMKTRFNHPQTFRPYQKQPLKKQKNTKKVDKHLAKMTVNQLAQILEIRESQNFQLSQQMLQGLRKKVSQTKECSVCRIELEIGEEGIIPECKHVFHEQCLTQWIKRKNTCPSCRAVIIRDLPKNQF